jgi:hypothetical protein
MLQGCPYIYLYVYPCWCCPALSYHSMDCTFAPIVPRPEFIKRCIKWIKGEKDNLIPKLKSILLESSSTTREQEMPSGLDGQNQSNTDSANIVTDVNDDIKKLRSFLLLLGVLASTITYQAGLNPPGGFWIDIRSGTTHSFTAMPLHLCRH